MDIFYRGAKNKQYSKVAYLECVLDKFLTGESTAIQVCTKITSKLKVLYRKKIFLMKDFRRLLSNVLIQPHFNYACEAYYPNLSKKYRNKLQVLQNKCLVFCLQLDNKEHIGNEQIHKLNWLPTD